MFDTNNSVGYCGNCGTELFSGQKFCPECGKQIDQGTTTKTTLSPLKSTSKSIHFKGFGQQVSPSFKLQQGLVTFRLTHNGKRNFIVWLLDYQGTRVGLLVNRTGIFNGAKALGIKRAGIFLLDIAADGDWTVNIE